MDDRFEAALGRRRGHAQPTKEQLDAAVAALLDIGAFPPGYGPLAEAMAVLSAGGDLNRADLALREICGLPDESMRDYAEFVLASVAALN